jgi:SAM-dependent methyltransferase
MTTSLGHCRICNLEDFDDPDLRSLMRESFAVLVERFGRDFPTGREYRKYWEVAMMLRVLRDKAVLREGGDVLGVAAGVEATIYWLTNHVRRVFATDLYDASEDWANQAPPAALIDPAPFASCRWNPRRLVVQHMDALDLRYEDESFDAVFSASSIEHFGGWPEVRKAAAEAHRVLRPGGVFALSTEYRIDGPSPGFEGTLMFDADELSSLLLDGLDWELVEPIDTTVSQATLDTVVPFEEAALDVRAQREWSTYPHIVLEHLGLTWTSMHVALQKPA